MQSSVVKRSVVIDGHKTSVSLEGPFWTDLKAIAHAQQVTLSALVAIYRRYTRTERSILGDSACLFFTISIMKTSGWT